MKFKNKTFTITCTMNERWIPHFLGMLKYMQQLGNLGSSRKVCIYSDGDGDFRPKFDWENNLPIPAKEMLENDGDKLFDAG